MSAFSAAIFDLDGTITDSSLLHWQTFNEVLKPYKVSIAKDVWLRVYEGTGTVSIFEDVLAKHGLLGKVDIEELRARRRARFAELATRQLVPVHGFAAFFDQLGQLRVPTIIATNADEQNILLSLRILKLDDERRVSAAEAGKFKPDPAVYLLACKRLRLAPAQCVVFEDSVPGVVAAKRAGCYCVALLTTTGRAALAGAGADLIVRDYTQLSAGLLFSQAKSP